VPPVVVGETKGKEEIQEPKPNRELELNKMETLLEVVSKWEREDS
jgi:hypothetical protein